MSSVKSPAPPVQLLALTAMHDLPGNRRTDKLFGGLSVALLLTVGAMMIALAWSQMRPSPISQPARPQPPQTALTSVPTETPIAVAKIALPPPPSAPARATVVKAHAEPSNQADREVFNRPALEHMEIARIDKAHADVLQERVFASLGPRSEPPATPQPEITVAARATPVPRFESLEPNGPKTSVAREIDLVVPLRKISAEKIPERRQRRIASPQAEQAVTNVAATIADGRALLRILEHGKGPSIEIAWPTSARLRSRLYRVFVKCYGLQPGIVSANDAAYVLNARTGEIIPLDLDRTSGFVRVVSGAPVAGEMAAFGRLRRALADVANSTPVRTFPRRFDAMLLGGLRAITGNAYAAGGSLRASYELNDDRVRVTRITVDGVNRAGAIDLSSATTCT